MTSVPPMMAKQVTIVVSLVKIASRRSMEVPPITAIETWVGATVHSPARSTPLMTPTDSADPLVPSGA